MQLLSIKNGIPSGTAQKVYKIVFPIEEAPAISPSTGQYESSQTIEIKVPDGYTAYYTMNGNDTDNILKEIYRAD